MVAFVDPVPTPRRPRRPAMPGIMHPNQLADVMSKIAIVSVDHRLGEKLSLTVNLNKIDGHSTTLEAAALLALGDIANAFDRVAGLESPEKQKRLRDAIQAFKPTFDD